MTDERHLRWHAIWQGYVAIRHALEHKREFCSFNPLARSPVALTPRVQHPERAVRAA